jgi:dihydroflavonol-4-reductase
MSEAPMALVTGANGFLGARLVRHLVEQGERVKAFVRAGANLDQLRDLPYDQVEIAVGDITASHTVYAALSRCNRMYHVAAPYKLWDRKPQQIIDGAVRGTEETLEAARRRDLKKIVVTSALVTIGPNDKAAPLTEEDDYRLPADTEAYMKAKHAQEQVALEQAEAGLPVVVVNPGALFGPGDWRPTPTGKMLLEGLKMPFMMYPDTGGLSVTDVDDVAAGHRLAMEKGRVGERYILAGDNMSHREIFEVVADLAGIEQKLRPTTQGMAELGGRVMELLARIEVRDPLFSYRLARDMMFAYQYGSSEKAEQELGYSHRPARKTLLRSLRWMLEHGYVPEKRARQLALARA